MVMFYLKLYRHWSKSGPWNRKRQSLKFIVLILIPTNAVSGLKIPILSPHSSISDWTCVRGGLTLHLVKNGLDPDPFVDLTMAEVLIRDDSWWAKSFQFQPSDRDNRCQAKHPSGQNKERCHQRAFYKRNSSPDKASLKWKVSQNISKWQLLWIFFIWWWWRVAGWASLRLDLADLELDIEFHIMFKICKWFWY